MWWKLILLAAGTLLLVVGAIPIRTHAVKYDIDLRKGDVPQLPPPSPSLHQLLGAMYLTPGTAVVIACILAAAIYLAVRIIRTR